MASFSFTFEFTSTPTGLKVYTELNENVLANDHMLLVHAFAALTNHASERVIKSLVKYYEKSDNTSLPHATLKALIELKGKTNRAKITISEDESLAKASKTYRLKCYMALTNYLPNINIMLVNKAKNSEV